MNYLKLFMLLSVPLESNVHLEILNAIANLLACAPLGTFHEYIIDDVTQVF